MKKKSDDLSTKFFTFVHKEISRKCQAEEIKLSLNANLPMRIKVHVTYILFTVASRSIRMFLESQNGT